MAILLDRPDHETDFHAWALDQAARLRAFATGRPNEPIDWELLAEEVEDMGRSERHACESFVELILGHLLKIEYARDARPVRHWGAEIDQFRINLERQLTPSIEVYLRNSLANRYAYARRSAVGALFDDPTFRDRLPRLCPYNWEQITGDWLPERAKGY